MNTKTIKVPYSKGDLNKLSAVQLKIVNDEIVITGIPEKDSLEYLAESVIDNYKVKKPDSKEIFITKQKDVSGVYYVVHGPGDYKKLRLHIGLENDLEEAKIIGDIRRYLDGGTTIITYALNARKGTLTFSAQNKTPPTDKYDMHTITLTNLLRK